MKIGMQDQPISPSQVYEKKPYQKFKDRIAKKSISHVDFYEKSNPSLRVSSMEGSPDILKTKALNTNIIKSEGSIKQISSINDNANVITLPPREGIHVLKSEVLNIK